MKLDQDIECPHRRAIRAQTTAARLRLEAERAREAAERERDREREAAEREHEREREAARREHEARANAMVYARRDREDADRRAQRDREDIERRVQRDREDADRRAQRDREDADRRSDRRSAPRPLRVRDADDWYHGCPVARVLLQNLYTRRYSRDRQTAEYAAYHSTSRCILRQIGVFDCNIGWYDWMRVNHL